MKENEKYEKKIATEFQKMMMETTNQNTKKEPENTREILKDISRIDVTRKKRKIKHTRIRYDIKKYIFEQFADKRTSGKDKRSLRNVVVKADKKFK